MSKILRQKELLKLTKENEKYIGNQMKKLTGKYKSLHGLNQLTNHKPKEQLNQLAKAYRQGYPYSLDIQDKVLIKHLHRIPKLIQNDLKYKGTMNTQQKLLHTDYLEKNMGESAWRNNVDRRRTYQLPFKRYASLLYAKADYHYIHKLAQHHKNFQMLNKRLFSINSSHRSTMPMKFFKRDLTYNNTENTKFMNTEQRYVQQYKDSLIDHISGKTLAKKNLYALVNGKIDLTKRYTLRHWRVIRAESNLANPQQIFTYANNMSNQDTSKALTSLTKSARITPELDYTVETNVVNNHLLPKRVIVDTLQANGLNHQAANVNKNATDWVQRKKDGIIIAPDPKLVKNVIHQSSEQYKGIHAFMSQYKSMNDVLQQAGIEPPSDNTKSSNKKHVNNISSTVHVPTKKRKQSQQSKSKQKAMQRNMNHIER